MLRLKTIICHYYLSGDVSNKQSSGGFVVKFRQPENKIFQLKVTRVRIQDLSQQVFAGYL